MCVLIFLQICLKIFHSKKNSAVNYYKCILVFMKIHVNLVRF